MLKKMLAVMLCVVCLAGCGGGSGGGSSSSGGDPKKEAQAMHDKYIKDIESTHVSISKEMATVYDLSPELAELAKKYKGEFEKIIANIEQAKISKGAEPYRDALKAYAVYWAKVMDMTIKQCADEKEGVSHAEFERRKAQYNQELGNYDQIAYAMENEYSKAVNGKPAIVMGIDGANYLAFSSSKVDIAITNVKKQKEAIGSNPFLQQEPMGVFFIVDVYMKNNQKDAITVDGNSFKLIDSEGREYSSSPEGHMALAVEQDSKAKGMLTRLNPNMGTSFTFVFDVPEELPIFTTKFEAKGGMTGKPTLMPLRPIKIETVKD